MVVHVPAPMAHYLLHVDEKTSDEITNAITIGDLSAKPGWIRMSIHPTMSNDEVKYLLESVKSLAQNFEEWSKDYEYSSKTNEYAFKNVDAGIDLQAQINELFESPLA